MTTPLSEYQGRLEARRSAAAALERRHRLVGNLRLLTFLLAAALAWLGFGLQAVSRLWILAPGVIFMALIVLHGQILRARQRAARAVSYYEKLLDRLDERWMGKGETGERFADPAHPYAEDLDLFGKGSLFELLCTARTRAGESTLAGWLLSPAAPEVVRSRQASIAELRGMLDLREDLATLGETAGSGVHADALAAWGAAPPQLGARRVRVAAAALCCLAVLSATAWAALGWRDPFLIVFVIELFWLYRLRARIAAVAHAVEQPAHDLGLLSAVLARLEQAQFHSARLAELRATLAAPDWPLSRRIARLARLVELLDSRDNVLVRVIDPVILWSLHVCFAIEDWRARWGPGIGLWIAALGEIEALSALAEYTYEHPDDPFAEFTTEAPCFAAEALAHPLLPAARAVSNDVRLGGECRVLVVSGSNMSGKSTLLRSVGVNAVLAQAGAPVRARSLRMSPLETGASIRVMDSLQGGSSRFYAELTHLRRIVRLAEGPRPVLFLLDEFLHGTNSRDRRIGAEAIVRGLIDRNAVGLITTHDLALAEIAETLSPRATNVHFQDHLENGRMHFDYRMQPGVVTKSNALELMRSMGLDV